MRVRTVGSQGTTAIMLSHLRGIPAAQLTLLMANIYASGATELPTTPRAPEPTHEPQLHGEPRTEPARAPQAGEPTYLTPHPQGMR